MITERRYEIQFISQANINIKRVFHEINTIQIMRNVKIGWIADFEDYVTVALEGKKTDYLFYVEGKTLWIADKNTMYLLYGKNWKKFFRTDLEEGNSYETEKERESNFENGEHYTF